MVRVSLLLVAVLVASLSAANSYPVFADYCVQFQKNYTPQEYVFRKGVYEAKIASFSTITGFIPGVNQFTDWTPQEIAAMSTLNTLSAEYQQSSVMPTVKLGAPVSVDWRNNNIITSVKDQGSCGACWAFTSAALLESYLIQNGSQPITIDLSEQALLECTQGSSCTGGYIEYGIDRIKNKSTEESQYTYRGSNFYGGQICSADGVATKIKRSSYYDISDTDLINLLQYSPVAVAVASSGWVNYASGILTCSSSSSLDHAVLAVGYTADAIIIKNSWGTSWGINGYAYVSRASASNCKITQQAHVVRNYLSQKYVSLASLLLLALFILSWS